MEIIRDVILNFRQEKMMMKKKEISVTRIYLKLFLNYKTISLDRRGIKMKDNKRFVSLYVVDHVWWMPKCFGNQNQLIKKLATQLIEQLLFSQHLLIFINSYKVGECKYQKKNVHIFGVINIQINHFIKKVKKLNLLLLLVGIFTVKNVLI